MSKLHNINFVYIHALNLVTQ